jgi:HK97 family phage major capsid protein
VQVFQTSLDKFDIPIEDSEFTDFVVAAEEGAYDEDTPGFAEVAVEVHKFTKLTKISEELLDDDATNLEEWMARRLGEKMARTEEHYAAVGTGTGQPQGVFVGGTAALTFDSTGQILAAEVPELFYKLQAQYRQNGSWLTNGATEDELRSLRDTSNWVFDSFNNQGIDGQSGYRNFYGGRPMFNESNVSITTTGNKTLLIGDFSYYALVERQGLVMQRNPFLYQANGQVGFFSKFRMGGAVMQAEAFQYGTMT